MRKNLHQILIVFSMIDEKGYAKFLEQFLNPNFSFFDYKFEGFNHKTGLYENVFVEKLEGKNQKNNVERYYRIAFEKLQEYKNIENRKANLWTEKTIDIELEKLFQLLQTEKLSQAKTQLENVIGRLAVLNAQNW